MDSHPIIFWNLLWYFERIAVRSHLSGLCLQAKSINKDKADAIHPSWKSADHRNVYIKCRWDNERLHDTRDPPLYTQWSSDAESEVEHIEDGAKRLLELCAKQKTEYRTLMEHIISGVQTNDLLQPIKTMLSRRETLLSKDPPSSPSKQQAHQSESPPEAVRSVYRDILFLTLVALGQDLIDLSAFDREYKKACDKLPGKFADMMRPCDKCPQAPTQLCRKLFRELKL